MLGIDKDGMKKVLTITIGENESAKYWMTVLNELKNRGVQDILVLCADGLTGLKDAISAIYPKTEYQRCIVHQIRNSLKYVPYTDRKELANDLKTVYKASTEELGYTNLLELEEKWKHKYQETKQAYNRVQRQLDTVCEEKQQLSEEKQQLQGVSDRYERVVRVLGENIVENAVQQDIQEQKALEEKRQMEQMPKGSIHERLAWGARKSEMENQQRKKNKTKNRGMER